MLRCTMVMATSEGVRRKSAPTACFAVSGKPSQAAYACVAGSSESICNEYNRAGEREKKLGRVAECA